MFCYIHFSIVRNLIDGNNQQLNILNIIFIYSTSIQWNLLVKIILW